MDSLSKIMSRWEQQLNADAELAERNKSPYSTIEGKAAVQLEIGTHPSYVVEVKDGRFKVRQGTAQKPLLCWSFSPSGRLSRTVRCSMPWHTSGYNWVML